MQSIYALVPTYYTSHYHQFNLVKVIGAARDWEVLTFGIARALLLSSAVYQGAET